MISAPLGLERDAVQTLATPRAKVGGGSELLESAREKGREPGRVFAGPQPPAYSRHLERGRVARARGICRG
jgi:hypothetical protein